MDFTAYNDSFTYPKKDSMTGIYFLYWVTLLCLTVFSYGFIDINLHLSTSPIFLRFQAPLSALVFTMRPIATAIFLVLLMLMSICYIFFLVRYRVIFSSVKKIVITIILSCLLLTLSFPAFTYDLFNYMATAKLTFTYKENPYIVMPIEIPNEPNLAYTRAANKVALYGPVWIVITALPNLLGAGSIWKTILAFKFMNAFMLCLFSFLIYRFTKSIRNVIFFAFNPLVLIETMIGGHNDIYMMVLAIIGLLLWRSNSSGRRIIGALAFFASWWVKGATVVMTPLLFLPKYSIDRILIISYWLLAGIFFILTPIREELYPWYAIWMISICALLKYEQHKKLWEFTVVLSIALELRNLPYMYMGYYGGPGPILRTILTFVPIAGYLFWLLIDKVRNSPKITK